MTFSLITSVVTQFWIHQDFFECYFISIIIYKNPKKLRKSLKLNIYIYIYIYIFFLESTASFHKNLFHRVNPGQTMSTRVRNEFSVKTVIFGQKRVHRVNTGQTMSTRIKKWVSGRFGSKPSFSVKTESTESIRVKPCRPG